MALFPWNVQLIIFIILICGCLNLGVHRDLEQFVNSEKPEQITLLNVTNHNVSE